MRFQCNTTTGVRICTQNNFITISRVDVYAVLGHYQMLSLYGPEQQKSTLFFLHSLPLKKPFNLCLSLYCPVYNFTGYFGLKINSIIFLVVHNTIVYSMKNPQWPTSEQK